MRAPGATIRRIHRSHIGSGSMATDATPAGLLATAANMSSMMRSRSYPLSDIPCQLNCRRTQYLLATFTKLRLHPAAREPRLILDMLLEELADRVAGASFYFRRDAFGR